MPYSGRAAEGHVGAFGREAALLDDHFVGRMRYANSAGDRQVGGKRQRRERSPFVPAVARIGGARLVERRRHRPSRRTGGVTTRWPSPRCSAKLPDGHSSTLCQRRGAGKPQPAQLLEVGEAREIEAGHRGVEAMRSA